MRSDSIPAWAADYVGLPFKPRGRDRAGLDCWGLARLVQREQFGRELPSYDGTYGGTDMQFAAVIAGVIEGALPAYEKVEKGAERCGDLLTLRIGKYAYHIGTVLGLGSMLHIERGTDCVIECYRSHLWRHRIAGIYRPL